MFDEKFVFNFEHEMTGNQLWSPFGVRKEWAWPKLEYIRLILPFIAVL